MSEFLGRLDPWSLLWSESLWRASVEGGIAIAAAWAIAHWCRFLSARVRCWVWRLACLKLLVAFVWSQPFELAVLPAQPFPVASQVTAGAPSESAMLAPAQTHTPATAMRAIVRYALPEKPEISATTVLFLLWSAGVACGIVLTARRWREIVRLRRHAVSVQSAAWLRELGDEAERMAVRRLPELCSSQEAHNVQLVGSRRPAVILPASSLVTLSEEERRLVLAHELAHLKRRDLAWNWLPAVARCLFFFHPLVWVLVRGWCQAQEAACDELVIQGTAARRGPYGRLLLKMSTRWPDERRNALVAAGISGSYRQLEQRILAMTHVKPHSPRKLAVAAAASLLIVIGGVIPWQLVAQESVLRLADNLPPGTQLNIAPTENRAVTTTSSTGSFDVSADGSSSGSSSTSVILPGKIYLRASVEIKTTNGATGKYSGIMVVDPNSGQWERLDADGFNIRVSPQGDRLAFCQFFGSPDSGGRTPSRLVVSDSHGRTLVQIDKDGGLPMWSPDGKRLLYSHDTWTKDETLSIPETDEVDDWSRDGEWVVTVSNRQPPFGSGYQLYVMHPDGTHERRITEGHGLNCYPRFRPGTNQVAYHHKDGLWLVDLDGSNRKLLLTCDKNGVGAPNGACCWSPDGNWIGISRFNWQTEVPGVSNPKRERVRVAGAGRDWLEIIAADGTSHGVLALKDVTKIEFIDSADWR
jgi:beta-lactamase regulating signal transducer with metallopeptidase domain